MTNISMRFSMDKKDFLSAVKEGNENFIRKFIGRYPEKWKEVTTKDGETALHLSQNAKISKLLISSGANIEALDKWGFTPFLQAVWMGHCEVVKVFIQCGCNISARTSDGDGAVALASEKGHLDIARTFVRMGFDLDEPDQDGYTSLHWACHEGRAQTAEFLISSGANVEALDKWGFTPFLRAVFMGHSEVMTVLIQRGCNIFVKTTNGDGALALASVMGHLDIARALVGLGYCVNEPHHSGYSSLHRACQKGHALIAEFLISSGAHADAFDELRLTPFLWAVINGFSDVVKIFIHRYCSSIFAKTSNGDGALALASQKGHSDIAGALLEIGFSVNETHQGGCTSLHWACHEGRAQTAGFLILSGANIEALDELGFTPFLLTILKGHSDVMNVLIKCCCSTSARTTAGDGALALAIVHGHLDIAKELVQMGFRVNEPDRDGYTSLHWACQEGHAKAAEFLISCRADVEALDKWGFSPFLRAVLMGHSKAMKILVKRQCKIYAKTSTGNGALALASQKGYLKIARKLVGMGLSVNQPHQNDFTSLHWACHQGHTKTAEFLISSGANIEAINKFGRTPLHQANFSKQYDVVSALERILGSRATAEEDRNDRSHREVSEDSDLSSEEGERGVPSICNAMPEDADRSQEIYDMALKRGSVTVNRSRVIVAGQDGAGKSCLVDSFLDRPFEKDKASTQGAAVTMTHTTTSGWVETFNKEHLDPLIAESVCRMNRSTLTSLPLGFSQSSYYVINSQDLDSESEVAEADETERHYNRSPEISSLPAPAVETVAENLKTFGLQTKTLTPSQQLLINTFLANKPSEDDLSKKILGVRDIWDLGGQELYLATHSALMPDSESFGLAMYMIVIDISKSLSEKAKSNHRSSDGEIIEQTSESGWIRTNGDFPLYWFGSITAAHEDTPLGNYWLGKDEEVAPPPVFAIGSHRDVLNSDKTRFPSAESVEKWLTEQGDLLDQLLSESDFMKHIVVPKKHGVNDDNEDFSEMAHFFKRLFLIDNSVSGSGSPCKGVNEIRERVDRITKSYSKRMKKQPLFWVYLERLLFHWSEAMKTVVAKVDEVVELAKLEKICDISSRDEVIEALKYLANVGAILFYPEVDDLKDFVFTRPMWVIKALSAFVTPEKPGPYMIPKWNILKLEGKMSNDLMNYRLKQMRLRTESSDVEDSNSEKIKEENKLIQVLLELLDVITPVERSPETEFYVPSMLKAPLFCSPTYWERLISTDSDTLCCNLPAPLIVFPRKMKFVPECLFFRLITRFLKAYPNKPRLSRHQCIFLVQDKDSPVEVEVELLYHSRGKWIALTIQFIDEEEDAKQISKHFFATIKNELRQQMKNVCQQGMRGFKYSICCQTKKADRELDINFKDIPVIFDEKCDYSEPQRKISKLYNPFSEPLSLRKQQFQVDCWLGHQLVGSVQQDALPKAINKRLTHVVGQLVKSKWDQFAFSLGQNSSDILEYQEKSKNNFVRVLMVIDDWIAGSAQNATANSLIQACEMCGIHRNKIEAVYKED